MRLSFMCRYYSIRVSRSKDLFIKFGQSPWDCLNLCDIECSLVQFGRYLFHVGYEFSCLEVVDYPSDGLPPCNLYSLSLPANRCPEVMPNISICFYHCVFTPLQDSLNRFSRSQYLSYEIRQFILHCSPALTF